MNNLTEEGKRKISEAQRGRKMSEEVRKKISEARKKWWNNLTPKQEMKFRKSRSKGMREWWKRKSPEEKAEINRNRALGLKRAHLLRAGVDSETIEEIITEMRESI